REVELVAGVGGVGGGGRGDGGGRGGYAAGGEGGPFRGGLPPGGANALRGAFPAAGGLLPSRGAFPPRGRWFKLEPFALKRTRAGGAAAHARHGIVAPTRRGIAARASLDRARTPAPGPTPAQAHERERHHGRDRGKADQREGWDSRRGRPHPVLPCNTRRARHGAARGDEVRSTVRHRRAT